MKLESNKSLLKQIVLLKKYLNFSDIFNKAKIDKLLKYLHHNLVIEL